MQRSVISHRPDELQHAAVQLFGSAKNATRVTHVLSRFIREASAILPTIEEAGAVVRQDNDPATRLSLHALVTSPANIEFGYRGSELLDLLQHTQEQLQRALVVTAHYDSYVNVNGTLKRKQQLTGQYHASTPESQFALCAAQVLDILEGIRQHDAFSDGNSAYLRSHQIVSSLLEKTGARLAFDEMGFKLDAAGTNYEVPSGHPDIPRVTQLSSLRQEYAFIAIHQAFETLFHDIVSLLRQISDNSLDDHVVAQRIEDITAFIDASTELFTVLEGLIDKEAFLETVRNCFIIASAAQSQQYHRMQRLIGMPFDVEFQERRMGQVEMIIGAELREEIEQEMSSRSSLKEHFSDENDVVDSALRNLDIALLRFKVQHGRTMLVYLDPQTPGSAGTRITQYFAEITAPVFPRLFTDEERRELTERADKAIERDGQQSDQFESIDQYLQTIPANMQLVLT